MTMNTYDLLVEIIKEDGFQGLFSNLEDLMEDLIEVSSGNPSEANNITITNDLYWNHLDTAVSYIPEKEIQELLGRVYRKVTKLARLTSNII